MRITVSLTGSKQLRPAPEIVDAGLITVENLLFRGKQELWKEVADVKNMNIRVSQFISPFSIIRVFDKHGGNFPAMVTSFNINITPDSQTFECSAIQVVQNG